MAGVGRCHRRVSGRCTRPGSQPCPTPSWAVRQRPLVPVRVAGRCDPARSAPGRCSPRTRRLGSPAPRVAQRRRGRLEPPRSRTGSSRCQRHRVHAAGPAIARSRVLSNSCSCSSKSRRAELRAVGPSIRRRSSARCRTRRMGWSPAIDRESLGRRGHGLVELLCLREGDGQAEQQYGAVCCRAASVVTLDAEGRLT
jgi:hypothetical protein